MREKQEPEVFNSVKTGQRIILCYAKQSDNLIFGFDSEPGTKVNEMTGFAVSFGGLLLQNAFFEMNISWKMKC